MTSFAEIKAQFEHHTSQATNFKTLLDQAYANERVAVAAHIKTQIAEWDLRPSDLFVPKTKSKESKPKTSSIPQFRDPISGDTWSGRGNQPKWVKGQDKNKFLNPEWRTVSIANQAPKSEINPAPNSTTDQTDNPISNRIVDAVSESEINFSIDHDIHSGVELVNATIPTPQPSAIICTAINSVASPPLANPVSEPLAALVADSA